MKTTSGNLIKCLLAFVIGGLLLSGAHANSRCPGTSCTPAPPGIQCQPSYGRDNGCCPEWRCSNGQTVYGKWTLIYKYEFSCNVVALIYVLNTLLFTGMTGGGSSSSGGSSFQSFSSNSGGGGSSTFQTFSSSTGGGNPFGGGGNPLGNMMNNLFGGLFGR